jgi:hypothetical protein
MIECTLVGWLTLIVLIFTGAIVCWYSIETRELRQQAERQTKESQLQTELQNCPFLSVMVSARGMVNPDGGAEAVKIINLGKA